MSIPKFDVTIVNPAEADAGFVSRLSVGDGYVYASGGTHHAPLFLASSNARVFHPRATPETSGLRHHLVVDDRIVVAGEYGRLALSFDQAETWEAAEVAAAGCLYCVLRTPADELLVGGDGGTLLRSQDRGESWESIDAGGGRLLSGYVDRPGTTFLFGDGLSVWDGERLTMVDLGLRGPLCAMTRIGGHLVAVGDAGQVWRSTDGREWSAVSVPVDEDLEGVARVAGGILVVGDEGTVLWSEDEGSSFTPLDLGLETHLWSIAPLGEGALVGADAGEILRLLPPGAPEPFASRPDVFDVPGRLESFFAVSPDDFLDEAFGPYLAAASGAAEDERHPSMAPPPSAEVSIEDEQDEPDDVESRGRRAYELLRPNGKGAAYAGWWGQAEPTELTTLRDATKRIDADEHLYEWRLNIDVWPELPERSNLFELLVHRDQAAYLGTGLVEAFAGLTCLGSLGNGDTYHLEVYAADSERRRVFLFDHETHTLEEPIADSLSAQAYLSSLCEARSQMRRSAYTDAVAKLSGRIAPPWHFGNSLGRANVELKEYEASAFTPLFWHYRSRWILYFLRADGVVDIEDLGELFMERFNAPLTDEQHEKWLEGAATYATTALYLMWRCYLFGSSRLEEYVAIGRTHASRLVRDAARLIDELSGTRNHLGKITDMDAALARFRALDLDPDRAAARAAERDAARHARREARDVAADRVATLGLDTLTALAWENLGDPDLLAAIGARARDSSQLTEAIDLLDFVENQGWHHDGLILEHERDEACDAFVELGEAALLPLLVGPLVGDPPAAVGEEDDEYGYVPRPLASIRSAVPLLTRWAQRHGLPDRVGEALLPRLDEIRDKYEHRRTAVVQVLGAMGYVPAAERVAGLLDECPLVDEDHAYIRHEDLVKASLAAIASMSAPQHAAAVASVLADPEPNHRRVRAAAARSLATLGATEHLESVLAQLSADLEKKDRAEVIYATAALAGPRGRDAIAALEALEIDGPLFLRLARDCALAELGATPAGMAERVTRALSEAAYDDEWTELYLRWGLRGLALVSAVDPELARPFAFRDNDAIRDAATAALRIRGVELPETRRITRASVRRMSDAELRGVLEADDTLFAYNACFELEERNLIEAKPSLVTYARRILAYVHEGERDLPRDVAYPLRWTVRALSRLELDAPSAAFLNELLLHSSRDVKDPVLREPPRHLGLVEGMKAVRAEKWGWQESTAREWLKEMQVG